MKSQAGYKCSNDRNVVQERTMYFPDYPTNYTFQTLFVLFLAVIFFMLQGCTLSRGIANGSGSGRPPRAAEWVWYGNYNIMLGHFDKALEGFTTAIEIDPDKAKYYYLRGSVFEM